MALEFTAFAAPDAHIVFLHQHPGLVHDYLEGRPPQGVAKDSLPADWPLRPLADLGPWELNHRNADLYHWILNGGPALATGAGSIFQTWFATEIGAAITLDAHNERFAFRADRLAELLTLVDRVSVPSVLTAFRAWCVDQGKDGSNLDEYACQPFVDEFRTFGEGLREAIRRGYGLIW